MSNKTFSKLSVLYVEDEPLISLDAMDALEKCQFGNLVCAYTLKKALLECTNQSFDCAILDIRLERGLTSIDLGVDLDKKGTFVIWASGNGLDKLELEKMGLKNFYIKPFNIADIIEDISKHFCKSGDI